MEIHAPHQPVHSLRGMLTHLALVTLGVLIALSFEGIGTWREHRALVREARANILSEIRDNQKELVSRIAAIPKELSGLDESIVTVQRLIDTKQLEGQIQLRFETADLRDASRSTAAVTGAFGLMEYDEVKKYATVYGHQELFMRVQSDAMQNLTRSLAGMSMLKHQKTATPRQLEDWITSMRLTIASLTAEEQLGADLVKEYGRVLEGLQP
jgi:hypothetical protein